MFAIGDTEWPGLSKFVEEAGEALQISGKLLGTHGAISHWDDGGNLRVRLLRELADVYAAVTFIMLFADTEERVSFADRVKDKLENYRRWHNEDPSSLEDKRIRGISDVPLEKRDK